MSMHGHSEHEGQSRDNFLTSRAGFVMLGFLIIGGALLFTEHRAHAFGILIWLPLLACPLMHMFMHHGHDDHGGHSDNAGQINKLAKG
ncbi:MAG TPA: DUF2933 domain-containing protein [Pseudolabrys sp.]|nr:DUF2933 domain-containing protein [Pseudolabrys sp.]